MSTSSHDTDPVPDSPPPMPRWVKAMAVGFGLALLIVLAVMLSGGGHGPGDHGAPDVPPRPAVNR